MAGIAATTMLCFCLAWALRRVDFDYTPQWIRSERGGGVYVDGVLFPRVLRDQLYSYRVVVGEQDFGTLEGAPVAGDGSQMVDFMNYNQGYGIDETITVRVYAVAPDSGNQYLIAQWN